MHASLHDLLSVRDGEPREASIAHHIAQCALCARRVEQLSERRAQLQALPLLDAPTSWEHLHALLESPHKPAARAPFTRILAVAASVVLVVCGGLFVRRQDATESLAGAPTTSAPPAAALDELATRSQELEAILRSLPERPLVERVSTAATIDRLEYRIQWLDEQLSYAPEQQLSEEQSQQLWRERLELMDSLVKVRYAEAHRLHF